jgi:hypothetical protein
MTSCTPHRPGCSVRRGWRRPPPCRPRHRFLCHGRPGLSGVGRDHCSEGGFSAHGIQSSPGGVRSELRASCRDFDPLAWSLPRGGVHCGQTGCILAHSQLPSGEGRGRRRKSRARANFGDGWGGAISNLSYPTAAGRIPSTDSQTPWPTTPPPPRLPFANQSPPTAMDASAIIAGFLSLP